MNRDAGSRASSSGSRAAESGARCAGPFPLPAPLTSASGFPSPPAPGAARKRGSAPPADAREPGPPPASARIGLRRPGRSLEERAPGGPERLAGLSANGAPPHPITGDPGRFRRRPAAGPCSVAAAGPGAAGLGAFPFRPRARGTASVRRAHDMAERCLAPHRGVGNTGRAHGTAIVRRAVNRDRGRPPDGSDTDMASKRRMTVWQLLARLGHRGERDGIIQHVFEATSRVALRSSGGEALDGGDYLVEVFESLGTTRDWPPCGSRDWTRLREVAVRTILGRLAREGLLDAVAVGGDRGATAPEGNHLGARGAAEPEWSGDGNPERNGADA